jgi:general secretion pathway protein D
LRNVIRQLDIRRAQVLIEVIVAEVNDQTARELGIQWQATDDEFTDRGFIGGTNFPGSSGNGGIFGVARTPGCWPAPAVSTSATSSARRNCRAATPNSCRIGALAKALTRRFQHQRAVDPVDDHPGSPGGAILSVGQEVPFLTGQYESTGTTTSGGGGFSGQQGRRGQPVPDHRAQGSGPQAARSPRISTRATR